MDDMPFNLDALTTHSVRQLIRHLVSKSPGKGMPYSKVKEYLRGRIQYYTLRDGDTDESYSQAARDDHRIFAKGWGAAFWTAHGKVGKIQAVERVHLLATGQVKYGAEMPAEHQWAFTTLEFVCVGRPPAAQRFIKVHFVPPGMEHYEAARRSNMKVGTMLRHQRKDLLEFQKTSAGDQDTESGTAALLANVDVLQGYNVVMSKVYDRMDHLVELAASSTKAFFQDAMPGPEPVEQPKRSRPRLVSNRAS